MNFLKHPKSDVGQSYMNIVNKIMENIHNLYYHGNNEQMAEYNNRFLLLYREGNIKKLSEFNIELEATLKLYSA